MTVLIDFSSEPGQTSIGDKYVETSDGKLFCPKCLAEIESPGFGLAYGGLGTYWICENCDWFHKEFVPEEE